MQLDEWLCIGIPDDVMEQASVWIARLDADHVCLQERQRLSLWLDADPLHRWAFEELSQLYARTATLSQVRTQIDAPQVLLFPRVPKPPAAAPNTDVWPSPARGTRWQAIAVLTFIAIGLGFGIEPPKGVDVSSGLHLPSPSLQPVAPLQPAQPLQQSVPRQQAAPLRGAVMTSPGFTSGD